jgi:DNA-binding XRE family transcriptional regulator
MSVAVKTRHIENSSTVTQPGVILRFRPRTPARIINHIEREYRDYLISDDELVVWEETRLVRKIDARMTPGKYLRHLRKAQELTQQEIADKTDHRSTYISDMENDRTPISRMMAKKLAEIFNVSPAVFI